MAITGWQLHWHGATGSHLRAHGSEFEVKIRMFSNNPLEQANAALRFMRTLVPPGTPYAYASDLAEVNSLARASRYRADRELGTTDVWIGTIEYVNDTLAVDEGENDAGSPTENPLNFWTVMEFGTDRYTAPAEKVRYLGGFHGTADAIRGPVGKLGAAVNSAMVEFNPGLEKDANHSHLIIATNVATIDGDALDESQNKINSLQLFVNKLGMTLTIPKHCGKIAGSKSYRMRQAGITFYRVETVIEINRKSWDDEVPDRGILARAMPGDPDGRGGTISASDIVPKVPQLRRIVDADELPVADPVPLDGDGQPADPGAAQVYVTYQKYEEIHFTTLPWIAPAFQGV